MFAIKYQIINQSFDDLKLLSEIDIRYNFLLGNLILLSSDTRIKMQWEWIPLLDFAYCLKTIVHNLKANNIATAYFEFTENSEALEFLRKEKQLKISASFSPAIIITDLDIFEKVANDFHSNISEYIRNNISDEIPKNLQKYLSIDGKTPNK